MGGNITTVLDSQGLARRYFGWAREEVVRLSFTPCLATVLYRPTADPASVQYRDLILKDTASLGFEARSLEPGSETELRDRISELNADLGVHGIVVLYPLRCDVPDEEVMDWVSPFKDAEGLHSVNLGYLIKFRRFLDEARGAKCVVPATAKAVVKALQDHPEVRIEGAFVTIVNNSMRVGKPLGLMLENLGATVVKCYHKTSVEVLERCVRGADILVAAVPDPSFRLDPGWVKPGAAVLDVSHQGNVDLASLRGRASLVTVPPSGIGRVTRAMMFVNLVYCARYKGIFYP